MSATAIEFLSGVLLVSKDPARLASFYRDVLEIPIAEEHHEGTLPHYGGTLGEIHFAIHPIEDFPEHRDHGVGAVKLAFTVFDIEAQVAKLARHGVELLYPIKDTGFFLSTAVRDPDGNFVELTQLVDAWFEELKARRERGEDVVSRWTAGLG